MNSDFLFVHKPFGITTHQVDKDKPGFAEWLEHKYQKPVYVCHRLDKETTGAQVFTTEKSLCAEVSQSFEKSEIQKKYWLITDKNPPAPTWSCDTPIDGKPSLTHFQVIKSVGNFHCLQAEPKTGRTHQIRIHAEQTGVPLLGDTSYSGTAFPIHFLHCSSMSKGSEWTHSSPPPLIYDNLEWLQFPLLCQWLMSMHRRQCLYSQFLETKSCLRLIHNEETPLRVDLLGEVACAGWWREAPPTESESFQIKKFFEIIQIKSWYLQNHAKTQKTEKLLIDQAPADWQGQENDLQYQFYKEQGAAPGLFLDQREHRKWVQDHFKNKKVLNLFAYTGGFSLNAARAGASEVVTVDLSSKYIKWAKKNFELNGFKNPQFKFYDMDSLEYLKYAHKKKMEFDLIICDPPSFSRNKNKVFQIEKDYTHLIQSCLSVLSNDGTLLFSNNYEAWSHQQWLLKIQSLSSPQPIEIKQNFSLQWDFEARPRDTHMKSFQIKKK